MIRVPRRPICWSVVKNGRGKVNETNNLPSKYISVRVPARIETALESRKQMEDIERQADLLKLELARLETLRIKKLLDEELQKTFDLSGSSSEGQSDHLKQEDFVYFYCWTIEEHFFGLIQNSIQNETILSGHQRFYLGQPNIKLGGRLSKIRNDWYYRRNMVICEKQMDKIKLNNLENTFIPVEWISINVTSGMIFLHFYKSISFSLILQLSVESSNLCNVENTRESQEGSLPNFIKSADNTFLIKVPFSNSHYLKLFCHLSYSDLNSDDVRLWRLNPVTSQMLPLEVLD